MNLSNPRIQVVAAVLRDNTGRVLIAERPAGKPLAGFWEFPGGKLEPGEPAIDALRRELHEELGIRVRHAYRMLRFSHRYPEREVELDVWRVTAWEGVPTAQEGQHLEWVLPEELRDWQLLPADEPIVAALKLPPLMLVTPDPDGDSHFLEKLQRSLKAGVDLVQFRAPGLEPECYDNLALSVLELCRGYGAKVILNTSPEQARMLHADGLQLSQQRSRLLRPEEWDGSLLLGISCHSAEEAYAAVKYQPDYLILGPVDATITHPDRRAMGWESFAKIVDGIRLPVYAIGGLGLEHLTRARGRGAHGIAAIRSLWDLDHLSERS